MPPQVLAVWAKVLRGQRPFEKANFLRQKFNFLKLRLKLKFPSSFNPYTSRIPYPSRESFLMFKPEECADYISVLKKLDWISCGIHTDRYKLSLR